MLPESEIQESVSLEPGKIFQAIPKELLDLDYVLVVLVTDGKERLEYTMQTFLRRPYKITGNTIRFGSKKLKLEQLSVTIGIKYLIESVSEITDYTID